MKLINKENISNEYFDVVRYHFEKSTSAEDVHSVILILQTEGYTFSGYEVFLEHDHSDSFEFIKGCHSIEELLNIIEDENIRRIDSIELLGNVRGKFFPDKGTVNILTPKKRRRKWPKILVALRRLRRKS